jgi:prolyl oligopeptidase PreP (S9A serine peptidase family)
LLAGFAQLRLARHALAIAFACAFLSATALAQSISVDASQVAQVKNNAEASALIKAWTDKTRAGVGNMLAQENSVSKEIETGYARLLKSCELAKALKEAAPTFDTARVNTYLTQFDDRLARVASTRQEVAGKAQALIANLEANPPANCGLFSGDSLPCQTYKYKKEMAQYLLVSANSYYETISKRYQLYKAIANKSREQCIRPEFLAKLSSADEEYLVSYERKSTQVFLRLLGAVQGAFINQSAP